MPLRIYLKILCAPMVFWFSIIAFSQDSPYQTSFATKSERMRLQNRLISETIEGGLSQPLISANESEWIDAFWAMELLRYRSPMGRDALLQVLRTFSQRSLSLQRAALEAIYMLYEKEFTAELKNILKSTDSPKIFAMAVLHLVRQNGDKKSRQNFIRLLQQRFPQWLDDPILRCLSYDLQHPASERWRQRPPLVDLLCFGNRDNKMVIFSFQRVDRDYPGLTIIRKPDGRFLRNANGQLFAIAHLARSLSNLPGYLTNGNTPQGIFSLQGIEPATSPFIGPTPALVLTLPYEVPVHLFFHQNDITDTTWTLEKYQSLLPLSWRDYEPMHQAFYAGKAGRYEIIAHGTTIDPQYYHQEVYFPFTPSLGCLTTVEIWSEEDGRQLYSDQLALLHAINTLGTQKGYLVLVELDNKKSPVTLAEIILEVLTVEDLPTKK